MCTRKNRQERIKQENLTTEALTKGLEEIMQYVNTKLWVSPCDTSYFDIHFSVANFHFRLQYRAKWKDYEEELSDIKGYRRSLTQSGFCFKIYFLYLYLERYPHKYIRYLSTIPIGCKFKLQESVYLPTAIHASFNYPDVDNIVTTVINYKWLQPEGIWIATNDFQYKLLEGKSVYYPYDAGDMVISMTSATRCIIDEGIHEKR